MKNMPYINHIAIIINTINVGVVCLITHSSTNVFLLIPCFKEKSY